MSIKEGPGKEENHKEKSAMKRNSCLIYLLPLSSLFPPVRNFEVVTKSNQTFVPLHVARFCFQFPYSRHLFFLFFPNQFFFF